MTRSKRRPRTDPPARTDLDTLLQAWGIRIDHKLVRLALTHRSWAFEHGGVPTNERLEFLGDSVLGLIVTERIFTDNPETQEGDLAPMRAATVSEGALAQVARSINLGEFILLGNGELVTGGRNKDSILSDTVEALIAATYLTHGLDKTRTVVESHVAQLLSAAATMGPALDWKTSIQEAATAAGLGNVSYEVVGEGPDHARRFTATAMADGRAWGSGEGTSKKSAEAAAAQAAFPSVRDYQPVADA